MCGGMCVTRCLRDASNSSPASKTRCRVLNRCFTARPDTWVLYAQVSPCVTLRAVPIAKRSKLQVQIYVNRRPGQLANAVVDALPSLGKQTRTICWTAPLEHEDFAEPRDEDFLRAVGYGELADSLRGFWPARGPVWDGSALRSFPIDVPASFWPRERAIPARSSGQERRQPKRRALASRTRSPPRKAGSACRLTPRTG
jgi:hypothetical protein